MKRVGTYQRLEFVIRVVIAAAFVVAVVGWDYHLRAKDWQVIAKHAEVIEDNLWNLNADGCVNYLKIAAKFNNYEELVVYSVQDEVFIRVKEETVHLLEFFLRQTGLIPKIKLQADISHSGIIIGRIEAVHRHDSIYTYLYFSAVILLAMLSLRFFIRILQAKETLEGRVRERTKELDDEKERLAVTLRSIGDGVITTDLDGRVMLINTVSEHLTGWSQEEAVGRPIVEVFNIINEQTEQRCDNPVEKVLATGKIIGLANHTALISKDGTRHVIEDSGAPIFDKKGSIIGTVLVYRDVTEEKRTKEELAKVKKLESVGVLAGGIAHDFNNILAAILGNVELAALYIEPGSQAHTLLEESKKASIRAKGLTQQLLTFSKGGNPVKQTASISKIIIDSANFVLHGSSVVCDYCIAEDLWQVKIDTGQISQVIQNIIINARHAMPDGGVVEVSCENIIGNYDETENLPAGEYIKITIADGGTGIPRHFLDKVFDPYFSTKQEGSGLGLAICHSIICKHDGNIAVQSSSKGTTFTIYLPAVTDADQKVDEAEAVSLKAENGVTIMVMDDEVMVRDMTRQMLKCSGHEVIPVKDGHEAIEVYNDYVQNNRVIDIILMDLTIPGGLGGKDTVLEILRIDPKAKVVVASGYSTDPVMAHYKDYGFKASIAKPFQLAELNRVVNRVLEGEKE